jgi:putative toxin-antitoxin system antitoxin component (TIGR02293 family)
VQTEADWGKRVAELTRRAQQVFAERPGQACAWLCTPHPGLHGQTPLEALETESGRSDVHGLLDRIEVGLFA